MILLPSLNLYCNCWENNTYMKGKSSNVPVYGMVTRTSVTFSNVSVYGMLTRTSVTSSNVPEYGMVT